MKKLLELTQLTKDEFFLAGEDGYGSKRPNDYCITEEGLHRVGMTYKAFCELLIAEGYTLVDQLLLTYVYNNYRLCIYPKGKRITCQPPYKVLNNSF